MLLSDMHNTVISGGVASRRREMGVGNLLPKGRLWQAEITGRRTELVDGLTCQLVTADTRTA